MGISLVILSRCERQSNTNTIRLAGLPLTVMNSCICHFPMCQAMFFAFDLNDEAHVAYFWNFILVTPRTGGRFRSSSGFDTFRKKTKRRNKTSIRGFKVRVWFYASVNYFIFLLKIALRVV